MKGKIAFVLGAAVGYVLGTRAGRERYEQIKRSAQQVWHTEPVQRGVTFVKDAVDERADDLKVFVARVGADVLSGFAQPKQRPGTARPESETSSGAKGATGSAAKPSASRKSNASGKSAASGTAKSRTAAKKKPAAKSANAGSGSSRSSSRASASSRPKADS